MWRPQPGHKRFATARQYVRRMAEPTAEFRILGPVRASVHGATAALGGSKQRTVLAALLLSGGRILDNERLTRLLWGDSPPATVGAQINTYISRLRCALGPAVTIERMHDGYAMTAPSAWFDHAAFDQLVICARRDLTNGEYPTAARRLRAALALWQGRALSGVTQHLEHAAGPGLAEARMTALETLVEVDLILGRQVDLVAELTDLVGEFPLRERLRAALMIALYRCDRQADALAVYRAGRRALAEEIGIDPGETLDLVHRAVLTRDFSGTPFANPGY